MDCKSDELNHEATVYGPEASPAGVLRSGIELGGFCLGARLARGGMGEVWKAYDPTADRFVVIKLMPPDLQHFPEEMARIRTSFGLIHALQHQHICPVYLLGKDERVGYFIVMKYIAGQTLSAYRAAYVAKNGSFPLSEVVGRLRPVADALDYAHAHKVIHRDVKPQNVMVVGDGEDVQVVDFGLATEIRATMTRVSRVRMETSGTCPYMAPEQWRGEYQDARTDQYALGVVAYEILAGRLPFDAVDHEVLRLCVLNDPPSPIQDQPEQVNRALVRAMCKLRHDRFATCKEFLQALGAVNALPPVSNPDPTASRAHEPAYAGGPSRPAGPESPATKTRDLQSQQPNTSSDGKALQVAPEVVRSPQAESQLRNLLARIARDVTKVNSTSIHTANWFVAIGIFTCALMASAQTRNPVFIFIGIFLSALVIILSFIFVGAPDSSTISVQRRPILEADRGQVQRLAKTAGLSIQELRSLISTDYQVFTDREANYLAGLVSDYPRDVPS